jgi:alpha-glucoside transport system permease protein
VGRTREEPRGVGGTEATAGAAVAVQAPPVPPSETRRIWRLAAAFLLPALVLLGALVVYPMIYTVVRSFFDKSGSHIAGVSNYKEIFTSPSTLQAMRNNVIWVVVAPSLVTALGLIYAVLTERVKWATAFKVAVFMPMAISFLSAGVIWRLVYDQDPDKGLANAIVVGTVDIFKPPGPYPDARPSIPNQFRPQGKALVSTKSFSAGGTAQFGLVAIPPEEVPRNAAGAAPPQARQGAVSGTVWLDFTLGGGGEKGRIDPTEKGLPGVKVDAVSGDNVAGSATSGDDGRFTIDGLSAGSYQLRIADSTFREPFGGFSWLGPTLVTPSIIAAYIWIWAGFAMVVIGAGLAAIPRDVLEAARVDGANEWYMFRRVTVPLLAPVLAVVLVTLIINVLKVFDLVLVIAPGSSQRDANVIALQMWKTAFGVRDFGLGSALAVFLFVLVLPAMAFNIRRFKSER